MGSDRARAFLTVFPQDAPADPKQMGNLGDALGTTACLLSKAQRELLVAEGYHARGWLALPAREQAAHSKKGCAACVEARGRLDLRDTLPLQSPDTGELPCPLAVAAPVAVRSTRKQYRVVTA